MNNKIIASLHIKSLYSNVPIKKCLETFRKAFKKSKINFILLTNHICTYMCVCVYIYIYIYTHMCVCVCFLSLSLSLSLNI